MRRLNRANFQFCRKSRAYRHLCGLRVAGLSCYPGHLRGPRADIAAGIESVSALLLDATLTSPYKFYQYLVNVDDRDAGRYLRFFSLRSREEIGAAAVDGIGR